jgi:voltage-dependent potassium channel beta subunit
MEYRRLGKSGLQLSELSLGSWVTFGSQIGDDTAEKCMKLAYDSGVNFFDNAEAYASGKSEVVMGNIFKKMGWDRTSYVVSSKVFWGGKLPNQNGLSRKHIFEACHAALKRLQVDYLDLYFCHRPDKNTPIEESVRAMHDLIQQGKILYWGTSEWSAEEIMEAYTIAREYYLTPPTMEQPQYNLFHRERMELEYREVFNKTGIGTTIWSPLASGLLTGKYNNGMPEDTRINRPGMEWLKEKMQGEDTKLKIEKIKMLKKIADDLNTSLSCLSIAWTLQNPNVSSTILGASKVEQLEENLRAIQVTKLLSREILKHIDSIMETNSKLTSI